MLTEKLVFVIISIVWLVWALIIGILSGEPIAALGMVIMLLTIAWLDRLGKFS
jgi:hypothetical protein